MLVFLSVTILILGLIAFPVIGGVRGHVDMFENDGYFVVTIFGIRIVKGNLHFESNKEKQNNIILEYGKKKGEIHLNADKKDDRSVISIAKKAYLFQNLKIHKLGLKVIVGKSDDAFFTTMLLSSLKVMVYSFLAFLKSRYDMRIYEEFLPDFNSDKFEADFFGIISISIADIIFSFFVKRFHQTGYKFKEAAQIDIRPK